jgi:hypothetical protein
MAREPPARRTAAASVFCNAAVTRVQSFDHKLAAQSCRYHGRIVSEGGLGW